MILKQLNKEKIEDWVDNYFLQCTAYALMYEEIYNKPIEQIVVLIAGEDGSNARMDKKSERLCRRTREKCRKNFINITKR